MSFTEPLTFEITVSAEDRPQLTWAEFEERWNEEAQHRKTVATGMPMMSATHKYHKYVLTPTNEVHRYIMSSVIPSRAKANNIGEAIQVTLSEDGFPRTMTHTMLMVRKRGIASALVVHMESGFSLHCFSADVLVSQAMTGRTDRVTLTP